LANFGRSQKGLSYSENDVTKSEYHEDMLSSKAVKKEALGAFLASSNGIEDVIDLGDDATAQVGILPCLCCS
jgi:hypothetical protein